MRLSARELHARAELARERYTRCDLCAHRCAVDRTFGPAGRCGEGTGVSLGGAGLHFGEEPELVGRRGSGVILIAGCNLSCETCETFELSLGRRGARETTPAELAALLLDLQRRGAENANFVTPTHVMPALLHALALAADHGFALPVVWNCGGYESVEALRLLEGVVDIYLPDAKYADDDAALRISGCQGYSAAFREALAEMHRQTRVIVRHLVLPNGVAGNVMPIIAAVSPAMTVNVLSQYQPVFMARRFPLLATRCSAADVSAAVLAARAAGLTDVLVDGRPAGP